MIYLYTNKELIGASLLLIFLCILVVVNLSNNIRNSSIRYLSILFMIAIAYCCFVYNNKLKKIVQIREQSILEVDKFNISECPNNNYEKKEELKGEGSYYTCVNLCNSEGNCGEGIIQNFSLDDYTDCNIDNYGCFNKFPKRSEKCSQIKKFFTNKKSEDILMNWTDYQKECDDNRGCFGLYPLHSDNCKDTVKNV
tara:strand:+ start:299 stop:886 length:588 start_codon:yes stop_codon:yes gene_type:complete